MKRSGLLSSGSKEGGSRNYFGYESNASGHSYSTSQKSNMGKTVRLRLVEKESGDVQVFTPKLDAENATV
jgi:hypothetical protein